MNKQNSVIKKILSEKYNQRKKLYDKKKVTEK